MIPNDWRPASELPLSNRRIEFQTRTSYGEGWYSGNWETETGLIEGVQRWRYKKYDQTEDRSPP